MTNVAGVRTYRWWPTFHATPLEISDVSALPRLFVNVGIVTAGLCLPAVVRATGIPIRWVLALVGAHVICALLNAFVINPAGKTTPIRFHISLAAAVFVNTAIVVAIPTLGGNPETPLWMIAAMYACFNGSIQELEPSLGVLLAHVLMPLFAIPVLLAGAADPAWSVAAPLLCSAVSAIGYNHLAQVSARWLDVRRRQARSLAVLRSNLDEHDRKRIARDVHDSIGSSLAIVGLYGDLIDRHAERPDELRVIAAMVRDAARAGTEELSALLGAMTPAAIDLGGLCATIAETGHRATAASGSLVRARVVHGADVMITGAVRLALVRITQEALNNALRHGGARTVDVDFHATDTRVSVDITDDGDGFVESTPHAGRGIEGMRARVFELGGTFALTTSPGAGARVRATFPCVEDAA